MLVVTDLFPNPGHSYLGTFVVQQLVHLHHRYDITVLIPYFAPLTAWMRPQPFPTFTGFRVVYQQLPAFDLFLLQQLRLISKEQLFHRLKLRAARALQQRAEQEHHKTPFMLVHGHETFIGDEAVNIGKRLNIPSLVTLHSLYDYRIQHIGNLAMKAVLQHLASATTLIAVSERSLDSYTAHLAQRPPSSIIPNGVDPTPRVESQRKQLGIPDQAVCLLSVGTFAPEKHFEVSIDALAELRQGDFPTAQLLLVGRGQEAQRLRDHANKLGVRSAVHFLGELTPTELPAVYATASLFLHPSSVDSFSMVCLEAMSFGLPVVCTTAIGLTEFVTNGEDLVAVPPNDRTQFIAALKNLATDQDRAISMSESARRRSVTLSWSSACTAIATLYDRYASLR